MSDAQPTDAEATTVQVASLKINGVIICYSRCWACLFGQCYDPPRPHPWWDSEDVEAAEAADQQPPTGTCACPCATTAEEPTP